jgi:hypothetical protein
MNRLYEDFWQADQRRRAAQRLAARAAEPLQIIDARSWGQGASIALQAAVVALIFGVFLYCIWAI